MTPAAWLALAAGFALAAGLVAYHGAGDVLAVVALAGVGGVLLATAAHLPVLLAEALGWRALLARSDDGGGDDGASDGGGGARRSSFPRLAGMWWIGYSVNALLPVAQVGGELVRARLLARSGVAGSLAGATVVVGLTACVLTLILFGATGTLLLGSVLGDDGGAAAAASVAPGLAVFACLVAGFYLAQRGGLFLRLARPLERLAGGRDWLALTGGAAAMDRAVARLYRDRRAFAACCGWRLLAWLAGVAEVWLVLHLLGHPVALGHAFVLESLGQVIRSAGFAVPGALGVQEGGFLVLGALLGLPGEVALALSLVKRARDLLLGVPGLAAWQLAEGLGPLRGARP